MKLFNNHLAYLKPLWETKTVIDESFFPIYKKGEYGELEIQLMNDIERVIYVKTATLEREFAEGKDYFVRDGKLVITADSGIRIMPWEEYNPAEKGAFTCTLGGSLIFGPANLFHTLQYTVSYEAKNNLFDGKYVPTEAPELAKSRAKLASGETLNLSFMGDSITFGCNASGLCAGVPPYMPVYPLLLAEGLRLEGHKIHYYNPSIGGMSSHWGREKAHFYFDRFDSDLCIIAFGMNDGTGKMPVETFIANTKAIIDAVRENRPECEFVLVSTTLPNPISTFVGLQEDYEAPLSELAKTEGCAFLNMTELHRILLTRKEYHHMTGNNINHPTDFLARVYAMGLKSLLGM